MSDDIHGEVLPECPPKSVTRPGQPNVRSPPKPVIREMDFWQREGRHFRTAIDLAQ